MSLSLTYALVSQYVYGLTTTLTSYFEIRTNHLGAKQKNLSFVTNFLKVSDGKIEIHGSKPLDYIRDICRTA